MGLRKDYWNFICESVPKDDNVKHVQSIPDVSNILIIEKAYFLYKSIF